MKKVLHVIPSLQYGGISSVISNWHDVSHGSLYHNDYIAFNDGPLRARFDRDGSKVFLLPTLKQNSLFYMLAFIKVIWRGKYDVLHVHNSFKNGLLLVLAWVFRIKTRVCHSHTSGLENKKLKIFFPLLRWVAVRFSNVHIACGNDAGLFLYGKDEFRVVNNTIDIGRVLNVDQVAAVTRSDYGIPSGKKIIGHVGRFASVKNHKFILDIASKIEGPYHFVLVGDGPEKPGIRDAIERLSLTDKFTLVEPTTEIPELLNVFDVFVMPSFFEGVSLALLEAQAAGLNCLASDLVPIENDVGLGLLHFLPLDNVNSWLDRIYSIPNVDLDAGLIQGKFDMAGFTTASLYEKLKCVYD